MRVCVDCLSFCLCERMSLYQDVCMCVCVSVCEMSREDGVKEIVYKMQPKEITADVYKNMK